MTIKDCIDIVDNNKPNQYTIKDKVSWLSFIEEIIINDVLKTHEGYDGRYDTFTGYTEDKISVTLIVPTPYDRLYIEYLKMMIDKENGETARYNNSAASFNTYMSEYRKYYNKMHMPLGINGNLDRKPPKQNSVGLSEAEYENIKRDVINSLSETINLMVAPDRLADIVRQFVMNNIQMLKGKDGYNMTKAEITILGGNDNWVKEDVYNDGFYVGKYYGQVVEVKGATVTEKSMIDLQLTPEQLVIFQEKDLAFMMVNDNTEVTIYCIGQIPQNNYTIQVSVTEVIKNG